MEPKRAGEFAEKRKEAKVKGAMYPEALRFETLQFDGKPWNVYPYARLDMTPAWAVVPGTAGSHYKMGTLSPEGEVAFESYCAEVAKAMSEAHPELDERIYQITWEPFYPWGFAGGFQGSGQGI